MMHAQSLHVSMMRMGPITERCEIFGVGTCTTCRCRAKGRRARGASGHASRGSEFSSLSLFRNIDVCHLIQPEPDRTLLVVGGGRLSIPLCMHLTVSGALWETPGWQTSPRTSTSVAPEERARCSWSSCLTWRLVGGRRRPHVHAEKALEDLGHEPNTSPPPKWPKKWPRARPH